MREHQTPTKMNKNPTATGKEGDAKKKAAEVWAERERRAGEKPKGHPSSTVCFITANTKITEKQITQTTRLYAA